MLSDDLTVILTSSPTPSNPDIDMITDVISSLYKFAIGENSDCKIIIACDGTIDENKKYSIFIKKIKAYYANNPNITIVVNQTKGHLTGNIRNVINLVKTKFLLVIQHDLPFVRDVNIQGVLDDMIINPKLKHVRFNRRKNIKTGWDNIPTFALEKIKLNNTYISNEVWSDQNHVTTLDYYNDIVLKEVPDGTFMENVLNVTSKGHHEKYGTYIYGDVNDDRTIIHLDGAKSRIGSYKSKYNKL